MTVLVLIFVTCPFVSRVTESIHVNVPPCDGDAVDVVSADFVIVGCWVKNVDPLVAVTLPFANEIDVTALPVPVTSDDILPK